jgi:hypothetical protein
MNQSSNLLKEMAQTIRGEAKQLIANIGGAA